MKYVYSIVCLIILSFFVSCSSITSSLEKKMKKGEGRVGLKQPSRSNNVEKKDSMPSFITYVNDKGVQQTIMKSTKDEKSGEDITTVDLAGVTVVAKSKNVSERNGKVNIDFIVTVPQILVNNKWQLQLTPKLFMNTREEELDKILLSGADFIKTQKKGYEMYRNFLSSIIPDSAYMQKMFDEKGYKKALSDLELEFYRAWRNDKLSEREFIDWSAKRNKRYLLFNGKMEMNKRSIEGTKTWLSKLPSYWLKRDIDGTVIKSSWVNFLDPSFKISRKEITPKDSAEIYKRYFDYKKMMENERKKSQVEEKYKEYVRFPTQPARLDTIINRGDKFYYYYTQEIKADEAIKKMLLTLDGNIVALDESSYKLPPSDTLTYYISSMVQFLDKTPHYKTKIVSRFAQANMTAYINFIAGKSDYMDDYGNNSEEMKNVMDAMYKLTFSGELVMDSINMIATSSPEGSADLNYSISKKRAQSIKGYLRRNMKDHEGLTLLKPKAIGEDWGKLKKLVKESDELFHKEDILSIIDNERNLDKRENIIRENYKADYAYMKEKLYPDMRAVNFEFFLHRRDMVKDTIHTTIIDSQYMHALDDIENRQYKKALPVLAEYNDYNTAICLMSLGYDQRAFDIMKEETKSSNRDYLLSILLMRLHREKEAVEYFMSSVEQDDSKIYRGKLDPEINKLINTYNLKLDEEY